MVLKIAFVTTAAAAAGAMIYGVQQTREQVFYTCKGAYGEASIVNPRYEIPSDIHIKLQKPDGRTEEYDYLAMPEYVGMSEAASTLCNTGRASTQLHLRK